MRSKGEWDLQLGLVTRIDIRLSVNCPTVAHPPNHIPSKFDASFINVIVAFANSPLQYIKNRFDANTCNDEGNHFHDVPVDRLTSNVSSCCICRLATNHAATVTAALVPEVRIES
jgi:hypothetical protein